MLACEPSLLQGGGGGPGASTDGSDGDGELAGNNFGDTAFAVVVFSVTLAVAHAGAGALANGLSGVDGKTAVKGVDDFGLGDLFAFANNVRLGIRRG